MSQLIAGAPGFRQGDRVDFVDIRVSDGLLIIEIAGAPETVKVLNGLRAGYEGGWIHTNMPTLVDVSGFHGKIDWSAIKRVSELADWGGTAQRPSRVAYISPDRFFAFVIKAVSILFPRALHRLFSDRRAALLWLQAPQPY
jgi:hypothetical protein